MLLVLVVCLWGVVGGEELTLFTLPREANLEQRDENSKTTVSVVR